MKEDPYPDLEKKEVIAKDSTIRWVTIGDGNTPESIALYVRGGELDSAVFQKIDLYVGDELSEKAMRAYLRKVTEFNATVLKGKVIPDRMHTIKLDYYTEILAGSPKTYIFEYYPIGNDPEMKQRGGFTDDDIKEMLNAMAEEGRLLEEVHQGKDEPLEKEEKGSTKKQRRVATFKIHPESDVPKTTGEILFYGNASSYFELVNSANRALIMDPEERTNLKTATFEYSLDVHKAEFAPPNPKKEDVQKVTYTIIWVSIGEDRQLASLGGEKDSEIIRELEDNAFIPLGKPVGTRTALDIYITSQKVATRVSLNNKIAFLKLEKGETDVEPEPDIPVRKLKTAEPEKTAELIQRIARTPEEVKLQMDTIKLEAQYQLATEEELKALPSKAAKTKLKTDSQYNYWDTLLDEWTMLLNERIENNNDKTKRPVVVMPKEMWDAMREVVFEVVDDAVRKKQRTWMSVGKNRKFDIEVLATNAYFILVTAEAHATDDSFERYLKLVEAFPDVERWALEGHPEAKHKRKTESEEEDEDEDDEDEEEEDEGEGEEEEEKPPPQPVVVKPVQPVQPVVKPVQPSRRIQPKRVGVPTVASITRALPLPELAQSARATIVNSQVSALFYSDLKEDQRALDLIYYTASRMKMSAVTERIQRHKTVAFPSGLKYAGNTCYLDATLFPLMYRSTRVFDYGILRRPMNTIIHKTCKGTRKTTENMTRAIQDILVDLKAKIVEGREVASCSNIRKIMEECNVELWDQYMAQDTHKAVISGGTVNATDFLMMLFSLFDVSFMGPIIKFETVLRKGEQTGAYAKFNLGAGNRPLALSEIVESSELLLADTRYTTDKQRERSMEVARNIARLDLVIISINRLEPDLVVMPSYSLTRILDIETGISYRLYAMTMSPPDVNHYVTVFEVDLSWYYYDSIGGGKGIPATPIGTYSQMLEYRGEGMYGKTVKETAEIFFYRRLEK